MRFSRPVALLSRNRRTATTDYWYLWNSGSEPVSVSASFATTGAPHELDLWAGMIEPVAEYTVAAGRVEVAVALDPGETRVLAFDRRASTKALHVVGTDADDVRIDGREVEVRDMAGGRRSVALSNGERRAVTLPHLPSPIAPTTWKLHVVREQATNDGAEQDFELSELNDWREIPGLEDASGIGTYTTTVDLPSDWTAADRGVQLDLGTIWGSVQVYVNGTLATPAATPHQQYDAAWLTHPPTMEPIDVTGLVRAGANEVRLVLATTLKNAATAHLKQGGTSTAPSAAAQNQPYGLKGPVLLRPFGRASFTARPEGR